MMYAGKIFRIMDELSVVISTDTMSCYILDFNKEEDISELYKDGWVFTKPLGSLVETETILFNRKIKREYYEKDNILILELENGQKYKEYWEYGKPKYEKIR